LFSQSVLKRVHEATVGLEKDALNFLRGMVRIPTENPPGLNYDRFVSYVSNVLGDLGYLVDVVEVCDKHYYSHVPGAAGPRYNLVASLGSDDKRSIVFNGHYDVVPAGEGWTHPPYEAEVLGGRLYGRGACDMKSGIAAQVYAVEVLRSIVGDRGALKPLAHHIVADEETVGNINAGTGYLAEKGYLSPDKVECVVFTEPLGVNNVCVGHRGAIWGTVDVYGAKSHGGFPDEGADAVKAAADCVTRLYAAVDAKPPTLKRAPTIIPPSARKPSMLVGRLEGGTWANTVADRARFWYVRRLVPGERLDDARREVNDCIGATQAKHRGVKMENNEFYATPTVIVDRHTRVYQAFRQAVADIRGTRPTTVLSPGTFDIRFAASCGVDALGYGPGNVLASHTTDEWVDLEDFYASIKIMALALMRLMNIRLD
jgi:succinyl-diaminopimelate desuccinylase